MEILEITESIWTLKYKLINNIWSSDIMVTHWVLGPKVFCKSTKSCLFVQKERGGKHKNNSWLIISSLNFQ
jgi:hypothetical protein